MTCSTCKYYAKYEGVCCNGESSWRADFRSPGDTCPAYQSSAMCPYTGKACTFYQKGGCAAREMGLAPAPETSFTRQEPKWAQNFRQRFEKVE